MRDMLFPAKNYGDRPHVSCRPISLAAIGYWIVRIRKVLESHKVLIDSGLIFPFAGSVLVCGREQLLL
jgi:hypothetical protein